MQTLDTLWCERCGNLEWIDTRAKERFGRVNISQAEHFGLIEQQRLQASLRACERLLQILKTEFIREGFGRKFANSFCAGDTRIRNQLDDSELSLIAEDQAA